MRFPVDAVMQAMSGTVIVSDGAPANPDWMRLQFVFQNPPQGPELIPPIPCKLAFLPDAPSGGLITPKPADISALTAAEYAKWQTIGTVRLTLDESRVRKFEAFVGATEPMPRVMWFWPLRLTQDFLFFSVAGHNTQLHLPPSAIRKPAGGQVAVGAADWKRFAVSGMLSGTHEVQVRMHDTDELKDDAITVAMPAFDMDAAGNVSVWMAAATGSQFDDRDETILNGLAPAESLLDPRHPRHALVSVQALLVALKDQMIDAEPGLSNNIADALVGTWPAVPRHFRIRCTIPGANAARLHGGNLLAAQVSVTDTTGTVNHQHRLRPSGDITVRQEPPVGGQPIPNPPTVTVTLQAGSGVEIVSPAMAMGGNAAARSFDFSTITGDAKLVLRIPVPAGGPAQGAYLARLAGDCLAEGSAPTTRRFIADTLDAFESILRPAPWPQAGWTHGTQVFVGSRQPFSGIGLNDVRAVFEGLAQLESQTPVPIRPGEAILTWIVEGRINAAGVVYTARADGPWLPIHAALSGLIPAMPYTLPDVAAASEAELKAILRAMLLWNFWGLDGFTVTVFNAAVRDTVLQLTGPVATDVAAQNGAYNVARAAITGAGIPAPTTAGVDATIELRTSGGVRQFRTKANHVATFIQLQHAEYLRRTVDAAMPPGAAAFPSFSYMAYNRRGGPASVGPAWIDATNRIGNAAWIKNQDDGLRSFPLSAAEIGNIVVNAKGVARVNAILMGALVSTYGACFPAKLLQ